MKKRSHYRKILNSTLALLFVAVQLSMGFVASKTVAAEPASVFTELATHPQAAAQPTTTGKTISKMTVFNGKLITDQLVSILSMSLVAALTVLYSMYHQKVLVTGKR